MASVYKGIYSIDVLALPYKSIYICLIQTQSNQMTTNFIATMDVEICIYITM